MKPFNHFKTKHVVLGVVVVVVVFALGIWAGFSYGSKSTNTSISSLFQKNIVKEEVDLSAFWKTWNAIDERYPGASEVDSEERVYGAISGLVSSLGDPYSEFFNPTQKEIFETQVEGSFSGLGMEVGIRDRVLTVIAPLRDTPAYRAGVKSGDAILKINDTITSNLNIDEAVNMMRGERGTSVSLTLFSEGDPEPREISIVRDIINIPTLETTKRDDGIFVIELYSFSANSPKLFRNAMREFVDSGYDKLLLDLRGNPGGYLEAAVDVASWFLPDGKVVVIEDYGTKEKEKPYRSSGYDLFNENLKFVILIDGGSASASEIVGGAMQDYNRAILVGKQSFGKGSVQEVVDITRDTILKVTVAKWLTPNGNTIAEVGLTPDYEVDLSREDYENDLDPQMDKAVEILLNYEQYKK